MKWRERRPLLVVAICVCALVVGVSAAAQKVEDTITIDNRDLFEKSIKPPVALTHLKHSQEYGVACTECHHAYKDGTNVWEQGQPVQKCSECHPADREKAKAENVLDLKNAFHKNCQACHKDVAKEGKNAPVKCAECHAKGE